MLLESSDLQPKQRGQVLVSIAQTLLESRAPEAEAAHFTALEYCCSGEFTGTATPAPVAAVGGTGDAAESLDVPELAVAAFQLAIARVKAAVVATFTGAAMGDALAATQSLAQLYDQHHPVLFQCV